MVIPHKKTIKIISLWLITLSVMGWFVKYFLYLFLARHITPALLGDFAIAYRFLPLAALFFLLGSYTSTKRFLSPYLHKKKTKEIQTYLHWNFQLIRSSFFIFLTLAFLFYSTAFLLHSYGIYRIERYHFTFYSLINVPLASISLMLISYFHANQNIFTSQALFKMGRNIALFIGLFIAVYGLKIKLNSPNLVIIMLISFLLLIAFELFLMRKNAIFPYLKKALFENAPLKIKAEWHKTSLKLITNNILFKLVMIMDLVIIEAIAKDENQVGYYAIALTITSFIWLVPQSIYNFLKPKISTLNGHKEKRTELQKLLNEVNKNNLFWTGIITAFILIFGKKLLNNFGEAYHAAYIPLLLLTLSSFIGSMTKSGASLLAYGGYERNLLKITMIELLTLFTLGVLLTKFWDIIGMAIAASAAMLIKSILCSYYTHRKMNLKILFVI